MEFRCPACDTSYRVRVQLGQQVRCARCDHVWRIEETDFVIANEAPEEAEMPEEFSEPASRDDAGEDPGLRHVRDSLSTLFDNPDDWPAGRDEPRREGSPEGPPADIHEVEWPGGETHPPVAGMAEDMHGAASASDDGAAADARDDAHNHAPVSEPDNGAATLYDALAADESAGEDFAEGVLASEDFARQDLARSDIAEEDSPQKQISDNWFGTSSDDAREATEAVGEEEHEGSFERIMEGIEEVIAETSNGEHFSSDRAGGAPHDPDSDALSALIRGSDAPELQPGGPDGAERERTAAEDAGLRGAKVVQFTAPGSDQRRVEAARGTDDRRPESWEEAAGTSESMTELMSSLNAHADQAGAQEIAGLEQPETTADRYFAEERGGDAYEDAADALAASRAHVDDLRDDLDDAAYSAPGRDEDPYARDGTDSAAGYYDPHHEAAQRDSLAFAAAEDEFAEEDDDDWSDHADADAARYHEPEDRDEAALQHDDHARMSARPGAADDDALLAEYDFGEEAVDDSVPPEVAAQQSRRGSGILVAGAAWALFLAILAGAGWSALNFRERIVEALPGSEPVYAAVGFPVSHTPLALEDVSYALKGEPANVLTLTGRVRHTGSSLIEMPNLKITVRDEADETVLEDSRFLGKAALLPGETMEFEVDLDVPAERLRTVELKF